MSGEVKPFSPMCSRRHIKKMILKVFSQKLDELLSGNNDILTEIKEETLRLLNSGAVNLESYENDDFRIVKTILAVALHNIAENHTPYPFDNYLKVFKNLKKF